MKHLPSLDRLLKQLMRVPYLAPRYAHRVADFFLRGDLETVEAFCATILETRKRLAACKLCCNWVEGEELCSICSMPSRDKNIICVVESWQDLASIERVGDYRGVYHVLGGALSPLDGIGPEKLTIDLLIERLSRGAQELIFATNLTPEGEATAAYIASLAKGKVSSISRVASGIPMGGALEYVDRTTICQAMRSRRPFF